LKLALRIVYPASDPVEDLLPTRVVGGHLLELLEQLRNIVNLPLEEMGDHHGGLEAAMIVRPGLGLRARAVSFFLASDEEIMLADDRHAANVYGRHDSPILPTAKGSLPTQAPHNPARSPAA